MWKRRCRIVVRECGTGNTDENQFCPTCGNILGLSLYVANIKDAFLSVVKQRELMVMI